MKQRILKLMFGLMMIITVLISCNSNGAKDQWDPSSTLPNSSDFEEIDRGKCDFGFGGRLYIRVERNTLFQYLVLYLGSTEGECMALYVDSDGKPIPYDGKSKVPSPSDFAWFPCGKFKFGGNLYSLVDKNTRCQYQIHYDHGSLCMELYRNTEGKPALYTGDFPDQ